jgi:hypothetical protein
MAVEYQHFLIPRDNTYKPSAQELSRLATALLDGGYVAASACGGLEKMVGGTPADFERSPTDVWFLRLDGRTYAPFPSPFSTADIAQLGDRDIKLVWQVDSSAESGLKYPLEPFPD